MASPTIANATDPGVLFEAAKRDIATSDDERAQAFQAFRTAKTTADEAQAVTLEQHADTLLAGAIDKFVTVVNSQVIGGGDVRQQNVLVSSDLGRRAAFNLAMRTWKQGSATTLNARGHQVHFDGQASKMLLLFQSAAGSLQTAQHAINAARNDDKGSLIVDPRAQAVAADIQVSQALFASVAGGYGDLTVSMPNGQLLVQSGIIAALDGVAPDAAKRQPGVPGARDLIALARQQMSEGTTDPLAQKSIDDAWRRESKMRIDAAGTIAMGAVLALTDHSAQALAALDAGTRAAVMIVEQRVQQSLKVHNAAELRAKLGPMATNWASMWSHYFVKETSGISQDQEVLQAYVEMMARLGSADFQVGGPTPPQPPK